MVLVVAVVGVDTDLRVVYVLATEFSFNRVTRSLESVIHIASANLGTIVC